MITNGYRCAEKVCGRRVCHGERTHHYRPGRGEKKSRQGFLKKKNTGIFSEFPLLGDVPEELTICGSEEQLEGCCGKIVICERNPRNKKIRCINIFCQEICMWEWDAKKGQQKKFWRQSF